jgi:hypothetical protein
MADEGIKALGIKKETFSKKSEKKERIFLENYLKTNFILFMKINKV